MAAESSETASPEQVDAEIGQKLRTILTTTPLLNEFMILVLRCSDQIIRRAELIFDPIECRKAISKGMLQKISQGAPSESFARPRGRAGSSLRTANNRPSSPARPAALLDFGQPLSESDDRANRVNAILSDRDMRQLRKYSIDAALYWRNRTLAKFGSLLGLPRARDALEINQEYHYPAEKVRWSNWTVHPYDTKPVPTSLATAIDPDKRKDLVGIALNVFLLSLVRYDAYARLLMQILTANLDLPEATLVQFEQDMARVLLCDPTQLGEGAEEVAKERQSTTTKSRRWKVGAATVAGAALIGLTGGLAAPFLIGSVFSLLGGIGLGGIAVGLGALGIANPIVIAGIFGVVGGSMSAKAVEEITKEVEDFKFVPLHEPPKAEKGAPALHKERLRLAVGISGWIESPDDVVDPWKVFSPNQFEGFALQYEYTALERLGKALNSILTNSAFSLAQASLLKLTIPAILAAGMVPFALLQLGGLVDNPFRVAMNRSDKAGQVLATALIKNIHGHRPITLVGFSQGARVVYSCLRELSLKGAFGLVENAVLIGAPIPADPAVWFDIRATVTGRVVNVYNSSDLLLAFLYRITHAQASVAGLGPIEYVPKVECVDASGTVNGHRQYLFATGAVLAGVGGFEDLLDQAELERQKTTLQDVDRFEKSVHDKAAKEGQLVGLEDERGNILLSDRKGKGGGEGPVEGGRIDDHELADRLTRSLQLSSTEARDIYDDDNPPPLPLR